MKFRLRRFWNNLLLGLLLLAPIFFTYTVVSSLFQFATDWFVRFFPTQFQSGYREFLARGAALVVLAIVLFAIGLMVRNYVGRRLYAMGDRILARIPGVRLLYNFITQVISVFFANKDSSFKEVVLLEYPRAGVYALGFVTAIVPPRFGAHIANAGPGEECLSVFIPTTPNPTSGWFCVVPRSLVQVLDMTPAEGMKLVVSAGAIFPGDQREQAETSLLEKLESWVQRDGGNAPSPSA